MVRPASVRPEDQPYMALAEVAAYLGVTRQAAYYWNQRSDFPAPAAILKPGSVWATDAIAKFKATAPPYSPGAPTVVEVRRARDLRSWRDLGAGKGNLGAMSNGRTVPAEHPPA
jgi:prophage regulatory protein